MLGKVAQRRVVVYLGAMVVLHVVFFCGQWKYIRAGLPDFTIFYTAAKILQSHRAADLYNDGLQRAIETPISLTVKNGGTILPFNHPPFEALFFLPFAYLTYRNAYVAWLVINLGITMGSVALLRLALPALGKLPFWIWAVAAVAFPPIFIALMQGQDVIWVLFCYVLAYVMFFKGKEIKSGAWLAGGLCKFHLVLPFLCAFVLQRRKKFLLGFGLTAVCAAFLCIAVMGSKGSWEYPMYVWRTDHSSQYRWSVDHSNNPNLRALVVKALPEDQPRIISGSVVVVSLLGLLAASFFWNQVRGAGSQWNRLGFALNVIATLLVSYHTWVQDVSILLLPIAITLDCLLANPQLAKWLRTSLWTSTAVLFCSPLYLILLLRYSRFYLMTFVILVFTAGLVIMMQALRKSSSEQIFQVEASGG